MKFQKGFTLIELLVVVAIISLLSSIVLASIRDARDKAKLTAFQQEVDQYILALELYRSENEGELPLKDAAIAWLGDSGGPYAVFPEISEYIAKNPVFPFVSPSDSGFLTYAYGTIDFPVECKDSNVGLFLSFENLGTSAQIQRLIDFGWTDDTINDGTGNTEGLCFPIY